MKAEISRDGKRVYWTNGLYSTWDDQFYPAGVPGAMVKADIGEGGGLSLDKDFTGSTSRTATAPAPDPVGGRGLLDQRVLLLPVRLTRAVKDLSAVTAARRWLAVVVSGVYHGLNPAMGWPLAVSAGLMGGGRRALVGALGLLALGHLLSRWRSYW